MDILSSFVAILAFLFGIPGLEESQEKEAIHFPFNESIITHNECFLRNDESCFIADICTIGEKRTVENFDCTCNTSGWSCTKGEYDRHIFSILEDKCIQENQETCLVFADPTRIDCWDYKKNEPDNFSFQEFGYNCSCEARAAYLPLEGKYAMEKVPIYHGYGNNPINPSYDENRDGYSEGISFDVYHCKKI